MRLEFASLNDQIATLTNRLPYGDGRAVTQPDDIHKFRLREELGRASSPSSLGPAAQDAESPVATVRQDPASKVAVYAQDNSAPLKLLENRLKERMLLYIYVFMYMHIYMYMSLYDTVMGEGGRSCQKGQKCVSFYVSP